MKKIKLTNKNKYALVDNEDFEYLNQYRWHVGSHGYAVRSKYIKKTKRSKKILMHRDIIEVPEKLEIDHIDRNPLNNRKNNLRIATSGQNKMNRVPNRGSISKYKGVYWHNQRKKWAAQIKIGEKRLSLGLFLSERDAAIAYNKSASKYFKNFAYLNLVN